MDLRVIYRYLRPQQYNFARNEAQTAKKGGVCFRICVQEDLSVYLTYSVCHPGETFSKPVARRIADERAATGIGFYLDPETPIESTAEALCDIVLEIAATYEKMSWTSRTSKEFYRNAELPIVHQRLQLILQSRKQVLTLGTLDKSIINDLNLKDLYAAAHR